MIYVSDDAMFEDWCLIKNHGQHKYECPVITITRHLYASYQTTATCAS